jgi:hypothetical protein
MERGNSKLGASKVGRLHTEKKRLSGSAIRKLKNVRVSQGGTRGIYSNQGTWHHPSLEEL